MKFFSVLCALALAAVTSAQGIGNVPACAQTCTNQAFAGGGVADCGGDPKCICSNKAFLADMACCLAGPNGCDAKGQSDAVAFARQICVANGVTDIPSEVKCTSSSSSSAASTTPTPTPTTGGSGTNGTVGGGVNTAPTSSPTGFATRPTAGPIAAALGGIVAAVALL